MIRIMLDNTHSQENTMGQQFAEGTPVYDVNGSKVGTVSEQGVQGDNLVLQKGLFFPHDYFVPLRLVTHVDADGLYLNVTKDDVTNETFDNAAPEGLARDVSRNDTPAREGEMRVPVREKELNVGKQQADASRAHVHKEVVDAQQTVNVPTTYEELHVARVPVRGGASDIGPDAFTNRDFDIPLRGEEVVTKKEARVAEEVHLRKEQVTEDQHVGDTVRKERVRVEGSGVDQTQGNVPLESETTSYIQNTSDT